MDDIRYRVWCRNNNEWEKDEMFLAEDGSLYHVLRNGRLQRCRPDTHTVQFFTGLRDSKRTEDFPDGEPIYEGDIMHVWETTCTPETTLNITAQVVYEGGQFGFMDDYWLQLAMVTCKDIKCEVIGNIYENSDLIGGTTNE